MLFRTKHILHGVAINRLVMGNDSKEKREQEYKDFCKKHDLEPSMVDDWNPKYSWSVLDPDNWEYK